MHKYTSKLLRMIVLLMATLMLSSQIFGVVVYARGSSGSVSHSTTSRSSSTKSTPSSGAKSGSFSSTSKAPTASSTKSGSFSSSPKSSSTVGSSATQSTSSPKSSSTTVNNSTVIVNNHTYVSHTSSPIFFIHRTYYVDDYGATHYMPYRPSFGGVFLGIVIIIIVIYVIARINKNR